ncbi:MAG: YggT family protein [Dehalococcoidales bacterium]|nr:YggT family protein [Dehalococcoidales bacterium]
MDIFLNILRVFLEILTISIFIRAMLTWFVPEQRNILTDILYHITEPILFPVRKILPRMERVDFAPLVAIIILQVIIRFIP